MTGTMSLEIKPRKEVGTGSARAIRREGFIPGTFYGKGSQAQNIQIERRLLTKEMENPSFTTTIYNFDLDGKKHRALVRDVQMHPVKNLPLHIDLMEVSKDSRIHLQIPLKFLHEEKAPGLKKGGVLNIVHHSVDVHCSPDTIPDHLEIDLAEADIGFTVHFSDLTLPKGVAFAHELDTETVATIVPPKVSGGEGAEGEGGEEATEGSEEGKSTTAGS